MSVVLTVNGRRYTGWKAISVTRSIESVSGAFSLTVSDRRELPIQKEDECAVTIGDETILTGYVEARPVRLDASARDVTLTGYDKAQALVANSVLLDSWTFRNKGLLEFARILAEPHDIRVSVARGLVLPAPSSRVVVNPGDTAFDAIVREAAKAGVLVVSDGVGGVVLTRGGRERAAAIVQGDNLLSGEANDDSSERYRRYVVLGSRPDDDDTSNQSTRARGEAIDEGVRRKSRTLVIRPSTALSSAQAQAHADWQARTRAAQAEVLSVRVRGWRQPTGKAWPVNHISAINAPALGVVGDRLIVEANYTLDNSGGEVTRLRLMRPDAFTPDPTAKVTA